MFILRSMKSIQRQWYRVIAHAKNVCLVLSINQTVEAIENR